MSRKHRALSNTAKARIPLNGMAGIYMLRCEKISRAVKIIRGVMSQIDRNVINPGPELHHYPPAITTLLRPLL